MAWRGVIFFNRDGTETGDYYKGRICSVFYCLCLTGKRVFGFIEMLPHLCACVRGNKEKKDLTNWLNCGDLLPHFIKKLENNFF